MESGRVKTLTGGQEGRERATRKKGEREDERHRARTGEREKGQPAVYLQEGSVEA